jgi:hypothetical protein
MEMCHHHGSESPLISCNRATVSGENDGMVEHEEMIQMLQLTYTWSRANTQVRPYATVSTMEHFATTITIA